MESLHDPVGWTPLDVLAPRRPAVRYVASVRRWIERPLGLLGATATVAAGATGAWTLLAGAAVATAAVRTALGFDLRLPRALADAAEGRLDRAHAGLVRIADSPARPVRERVVASAALASLALHHADVPAALHWARRLEAEARPPSGSDLAVRLTEFRALCHGAAGRIEEAASMIDEARAQTRTAHDDHWLAWSLVAFVLYERAPDVAARAAKAARPPCGGFDHPYAALAQAVHARLGGRPVEALRHAASAVASPTRLPTWLRRHALAFVRSLSYAAGYRR